MRRLRLGGESVFNLAKATRVRVKIPFPHPVGHSCLCPQVAPSRGEGQEALAGLQLILLGLFLLTGLAEMVSCLRMVIPSSMPWLLQVEVWLVILWLYRGGLVQTTSQADFSNLCSFCLHFSLA